MAKPKDYSTDGLYADYDGRCILCDYDTLWGDAPHRHSCVAYLGNIQITLTVQQAMFLRKILSGLNHYVVSPIDPFNFYAVSIRNLMYPLFDQLTEKLKMGK